MLNDVMTLEEAAELWNKSTDSLRQACISRQGRPPRFNIGVEAVQSKESGSLPVRGWKGCMALWTAKIRQKMMEITVFRGQNIDVAIMATVIQPSVWD